MNVLQYLESGLTFLGLVGGYLIGRKTRNIQNRKDEAIAEQEQVKIKKEEVVLSGLIQEVYKKMIDDFSKRLGELEKSNADLTKKYDDILLRNAILEERAETYEEKYKNLEKEHIKLKSDNDKLHAENKKIRKELDILKEDKK